MRTTATSLYAKLGGKAGLKGLVEHFCVGLQADELLAQINFGIAPEQHLALLQAALGAAPDERSSGAMQQLAGLGLPPEQFERLDLHLRTTLLDHGVLPQDAEEVVAALAALRHGIAP